jgi:quinol monooxygenase YgiN
MYGASFHAVVKPGRKQEFIDFLKWDADVAIETEPGTLAFEVFQDPANDDGVYVFEGYRDGVAFGQHQSHEPFKKWVSEVRPEMLMEFRLLFGPVTSLVSRIDEGL